MAGDQMGPRCFLAGNGRRQTGPRCFLAGNGRRQNGAKMFSCWQWPETKRGRNSIRHFLGGPALRHYCLRHW